jgi:DNA-binding HxlR family transcriptional regulator
VKSYGQFCSIARTLDLLGERWTLLVVRELLSGSTRFNDIRRGIPRISKTMLSARLRALTDANVVLRVDEASGSAYHLTASGEELAGLVRDLGVWGQRWLSRTLPNEELDLDAVAWDMHRRVHLEALPRNPLVVRIQVADRKGGAARRYLLLRRSEVSLCSVNPGFPEALAVTAPLRTLTAWWRGDISLAEARSAGLVLDGPKALVRAFPTWFERYALAGVAQARPS